MLLFGVLITSLHISSSGSGLVPTLLHPLGQLCLVFQRGEEWHELAHPHPAAVLSGPAPVPQAAVDVFAARPACKKDVSSPRGISSTGSTSAQWLGHKMGAVWVYSKLLPDGSGCSPPIIFSKFQVLLLMDTTFSF